MKSEKLLKDLEEIKNLQEKIEKDFLENEREISKIESEVENLEILDNFAKAIRKVDKLKKEAESELDLIESGATKQKVNFDKRI